MRIADADILILPGIGGGQSSDAYWYFRWRDRMETARIVEQDEWDQPDPAEWTGRLVDTVAACAKPVVLVGHSTGALTIARTYCNLPKGPVAGAFLVAPGDPVAAADKVPALAAFAPLPEGPMPFPSMLIASRDDPYCAFDVSSSMALDWGSELADAGNAGHINIDSGHGPWPEGMLMFARFMQRL